MPAPEPIPDPTPAPVPEPVVITQPGDNAGNLWVGIFLCVAIVAVAVMCMVGMWCGYTSWLKKQDEMEMALGLDSNFNQLQEQARAMETE